MHKSIKISIATLITLGAIYSGYLYLQHSKLYPETDDAYVQAHIVNIAPRVSGHVAKTYVQNNQSIQSGQLLFQLDPSTYQAALAKAQGALEQTIQSVNALEKHMQSAKANLAERQAQLTNAKKHYQRIHALVKNGSVSAAQGDDATSKLHVAKAAYVAAQNQLAEAKQKLGKLDDRNAQIKEAKAVVKQAQLNLKYTKIYAPAKGKIANYSLRVGDEVAAGQSYFALVETGYWWAEANFKETDLTRIRPGQTAHIRIDMYPNQTFTGQVTSISPSSGASFSVLPPENATGNWVKVTQRFPVRVHIKQPNPHYPLRLGASCTVEVDTQGAKS